MATIDINCDMGEGIGNEDLLIPFISSANIACGYHAGDANEMKRVIELCLLHNVAIGAHPSFADKENFGRTEMQLSSAAIHDLITRQLECIQNIALKTGTAIHHVKPHGALYNMAAKNATVASAIANAIKEFDSSLIYYGLSGSLMISTAKSVGLNTASEVFADRTYQPDGSLTPRTKEDALIEDEHTAITQVMQMIKEKKVTAVNGRVVPIKADTVCIHGDGKQALAFAKALFNKLQQENISIKKIN